MGKIRVKTFGIEEVEKQQAKDVKKRQEAKETKRMVKGAHGGERMVSMSPTEEELANVKLPEETKIEESGEEAKDKKGKKKFAKEKKKHSKRYNDALLQIDRNRTYALSEALDLLKKVGNTKFDASVELHINTVDKGINGQVTLPHGNGKTVRVAIADPSNNGEFDTLLAKIEKGNVDFDVLIAHPTAMAKLAKVAKILGPRGLMPNPKSGTISDTPAKLAEKFKGGAMSFKTESQASIIHAVVGKVSFAQKDLSENIEAFIKAVGTNKVTSVTLKSTMSPGIKVDVTQLS